MKMKRYLAVLLVISMVMGSINCSVLAAGGTELISGSEYSESAEDFDEKAISETEAASEVLVSETGVTVYSVETSALKIYTDSQTYINPLYEDVVDESDLVQPSDSAAADTASTTGTVQYFSTVSEAAAAVREAMEARQGTVKIGFTNQTGYSASIFKEIFAEAVEHTGVSTQGDYLKWQYAGYHVSASTKYSGGWYNITYTVTMTYYTTAAQEAEVTSALEEIEASLGLDSLSDYGKVRTIYDYICANVTYDYDNLEDSTYKLKYTAYAALINGTSVCQGYAVLFYRMALDAGVDTRFISGTANGGGHGWNIVKLGDCYYNLDSTWDASYYVSGYSYRYFLLCDANFSGHTRDSAYSTDEFYQLYPMGTVDFDPETMNDTEESSEPVITVQPQSVVVANAGDNAILTVEAEGNDLSYSWYYRNPGSSTFKESGATTASVTVAVTTARDGREMYCLITDINGNSVTTNIVTLSIEEAESTITIISQPQSVVVANAGDKATLTVEAEGEDLSYSWYYRNPGNSTFKATGNCTTSVTVSVTVARDGREMYCLITDVNGNSVTTDTVTLSIQ